MHTDHDAGVIASLYHEGLLVTYQHLSFSDYVDTVAGAIPVLVCVHKYIAPRAKTIEILTPPKVAPAPLAAYIWASFDKL